MRSSERQSRIKEIEGVVAKLQDKGWRMEEVRHVDEAGEPFHTVIVMSCEPESKVGGVL